MTTQTVEPILFTGARLLDPWTHRDGPGDLLVIGGRIAAIGESAAHDAPAGACRIDAEGLCLAPGLVDMRVHLSEPGEEHVEPLEMTAAAAAAGGVTSLAGLPDTSPVIDDVALVEFVTRRAQRIGLANIHTYAAATKGLKGRELAEIGLLGAAGALGFTDGTRAIADALVMRRVLGYARSFDRLVVQHPEEPSLAQGGAATEGETASRHGLPSIPAVAELILIERDLRLVELTGARYHAAHVSTAAAIAAIAAAKARGLPVSCDTAPAYFTLTEIAITDYRTHAKLSPPLRDEMDRRAVIQGLADGTIDAIASDHCPVDPDAKNVPFTSAEPGAVGLETLLPLSLALYHRGEMPLLKVLRALTQGPSDILRLPAGRLAIGAAADLVLFALDKPWRIRSHDFRSKARNTPFEGLPVQGKVMRTYLAGRQSYADPSLIDG